MCRIPVRLKVHSIPQLDSNSGDSCKRDNLSARKFCFDAKWREWNWILYCIHTRTNERTKTIISLSFDFFFIDNVTYCSVITVKYDMLIAHFYAKNMQCKGNKIWWLCLVPTPTTRFASEVGYRIAKIWHGYTRKIFLWTMTSNSLTENEEQDIPSHILKTTFGLHASVIF